MVRLQTICAARELIEVGNGADVGGADVGGVDVGGTDVGGTDVENIDGAVDAIANDVLGGLTLGR